MEEHKLGKIRLVSAPPAEIFDLGHDGICHVVTVNSEIFVLAHENPRYLEVLDAAVNTIDGRVIQLLVRALGDDEHPMKLSGSDLIYELCEYASKNHEKVFLLGASEASNARACARLRSLYPGLQLDGYSPPIVSKIDSEAWNADVFQRIAAFAPTYLAVCLGSPKAELWISDSLKQLESRGVRFVIGLGGAADFVAGVTRRAPKSVQWLGLEWLFRLAVAPRQRFRRTLRMFRMPYYALKDLAARRR